MLEEVARIFMEKEAEIYKEIENNPIFSYEGLLTKALEIMYDEEQSIETPNYMNITTIDDGEYQGTLLFVVPIGTYQPDTYYIFKVHYGSCSACDTLEKIKEETFDNYPIDEKGNYGKPCWIEGKEQQGAKDLVTLIRHMIQSCKKV